MHIEKSSLIQNLILRTEQNIISAKKFKLLSIEQLNYKSNPEEWSILECLEHLNLYGDYYLPEIEKTMLEQKKQYSSPMFKSGVLGNYFANLMLPKENGQIKKMKSPEDKNPVHSQLSFTTIERFLKQQELLKKLLEQSKTKDLTKLKTPISISKWIKLRLGDTFRFVIYHNQRHIAQAERLLQQ
ncbi:MAG: DinB family protein [Bacteroidota bacterium]